MLETIGSGPGAAEVAVEVIGAALGAHPGSELVGRVTAAGESAQHLLGQVVVVPRLLPCGECAACRRLRIAVCPALHRLPTELQASIQLPARFLVPLAPPFLSAPPAAADIFRYAALSDGLLTPYSALVSAGVSPGMLAVVLGGGARAALAVVVARLLGMQVACVCPQAGERRRLCEPPYGALASFDPQKLDPDALGAELQALCRQAGLPEHGLTVLETTGSEAGRAYALGLLRAGATALLFDRPQTLPAAPSLAALAQLDRLANENCQILGAGAAHPDLLPELLAQCERAAIDLSALTRPLLPSEATAGLSPDQPDDGDALLLPIVQFAAAAAARAAD